MKYRVVILAVVSFLFSSSINQTDFISAHQNQSAQSQNIDEAYGRLPMGFELNQGQADPQVKYLARGRGYQVFLTETETLLRFGHQETMHLKLDGARPAEQVIGMNLLPGKSNYFIGNDPEKWRTEIPNYARIEYREVYPGVGLAFDGTQQSLEYDFIVAPGADPSVISMSFEGVEQVELDARGDLSLRLGNHVIYQRSPFIYQQINGRRRSVSGRYVIKGERQVGLELGSYDSAKALVIDPVIEYGSFLGGSGDDQGNGIKVDGAGNAYITGVTTAADLPLKNPLQIAGRGGLDAFVAKLNPNGTALVYSTYLGGSGDDQGNGIALDGAGNAYVMGSTKSSDFNTRNPVQTTNRGGSDAFVAKLSADGSQLVYATYLGSSGDDIGNAIATDAAGNAYVTGYTSANDFNTQAPLQPAFRGGFDAFVAKINAAGSALSYSTYLGGAEGDAGSGIAVDSAGNAYVSGYTTSSDFNTRNAFQSNYRGGFDSFIAKINAAGSALTYSTYLGGAEDDQSFAIAVDGAGNVYLTGSTSSNDFPTKNPLQATRKAGLDGFVAKLNAAGSDLVYASYLGGQGSDVGRGIAVDSAGNAYLTGDTTSSNFPTKNPIQTINRGVTDAFIVKLNAAGADLVYGTYLGGSRVETGNAIALDNAGNAYVTGSTGSLDFNTSNPLQSDNVGGDDAFIAKVSADGSQFSYSTYLGGSGADLGLSVALDGVGNAYVTGVTAAADLAVVNPAQSSNRGNADAFVAKLNANGSAIVYTTYFGGNSLDQGSDIAVDQGGYAYVVGTTASTDFSTRGPLQATNRGGNDAFIAKFSPTGNAIVYSTYYGGGGDDAGYSLAVDGGGNVFAAGSTGSTNLTTQNPFQSSNRGEDDAFILKLNPAGSALVYASYLGGSKSETGYSLAINSSGEAFISGVTGSTDFNTKDPLQNTNRGEFDAFVAKVNSSGSALIYSTYLGGTGSDFGFSVAVDAAGNAYVGGATSSTDFNLRDAYQGTNKGGFDAFIAKLNPAGSALVYSTYLGGSGPDFALGIAVDAANNVYLTGNTASTNFPTANPLQTMNRGATDAFVAKLNAAGSNLLFSTYFGGNGFDEGDGLTVDGAGNIYLVGLTGSTNFPLANSLQPAAGGGSDAFIVKLNPSGSGGGGGSITVASVSAASYSGVELATESIVAAFGVDLATGLELATTVPLPTTLAGTTVKVKDSAGVERLAPLFFVAPTQVNYQIPPSASAGPSLVTITSGNGKVSTGTTLISTVGPGLFSANSDGLGVAAAVALRVKAGGAQIYEPIAQYDQGQSKFVSLPLDLGPQGEELFLILFGTGLRGRSDLANVKVKIGGVDADLFYAGTQGGFVGLDQMNLRVPRSLAGRGEVDLSLIVDGRTANTVKVRIK